MITTNSGLPQLLDLQKIDLGLDQLQAEKSAGSASLENAKAFLEAKKQALDQAKKSAEEDRKARLAMELDSKAKLANMSKYKEQVFEVKSNEAYTSLQNEIAKLKEDNSKLEEQILVKMDQDDENRKKLAVLQDEVKTEEQKVKQEEEKFQKDLAVINQKIGESQTKRQEATAKVERGILDRYERIRQSKKSMAIAPVRQGNCGGCQINIRPQVIIEIQKGKEMIFCESCGRMLYVE